MKAGSDLEQARERLAGPEPVLLIEAPAGHGKTTEAVVAAESLAPTLGEEKTVLFLTHTNAARDTFNQRLRGRGAVMKTIHSLASEIVDLYSAPLGLPRPLEPYNGKPSYDDMVRLATRVLKARPEVALGLALRHPVMLVDEYQDCTLDQHDLIQAISSAAPTRLRLFGDDLQAIYGFTGMAVDWTELSARNPTIALQTPWRWRGQPEMGDFVQEARRALLAGEPIDLRHPPACVSVSHWSGPVPQAHQEGHAPECLTQLRECLGPQTVALTFHNIHALGLRRKVPGRGGFHEGSDTEPARKMLVAVVEAEGDPQVLVGLLVKVMEEWGVGMVKTYRDQMGEACGTDEVSIGQKKTVKPLLQICRSLYADPTPGRWLDCLRRVLDGEHGIPNWRVLRGDPIWLLARLRPAPGADPQSLLHMQSRARDAQRRAPRNGFTTIHKAKGLQFEAVVLPYCASAFFADDLPSRRLMYVALSRAQRRLRFLIPDQDPTPLLQT